MYDENLKFPYDHQTNKTAQQILTYFQTVLISIRNKKDHKSAIIYLADDSKKSSSFESKDNK